MKKNNPTEYFRCERHPYYIVAPEFREGSSGVRILHYLCHILNLHGYEAYICTSLSNDDLWSPILDEKTIRKHYDTQRKPIVVYPETIKGTPLDFGVIVRYLLNKPGYLGGDKSFGINEILVAYTEAFISDTGTDNILLIPASDPNIFNPHNSESITRHGRYFFHNRLLKQGGELLSVTDGAIELSPSTPRTLKELATIFKSAELLYCYEVSAIAQEARLCGCPVVYIPNPIMLPTDPRREFGLDGAAWGTSEQSIAEAKATVHKVFPSYMESYEKLETELEKFISLTQAVANKTTFNECFPPLTVIKRNWPLYANIEGIDPLETGIQLFEQKHYEYAIHFLQLAVEKDNFDAQANLYLALSCAATGLTSEAEIFIQQAISVLPARLDFLAALGEQFLKSGTPELALKYLKMAVRKQPDLLAAYPALGEALRQNNRSDEAIQLLTGAASLVSNTQNTICQLLEELLIARGDLDGLGSLCQRSRNDPTRLSLLIRLQTQLGTPLKIIGSNLAHFITLCPPPATASPPPLRPKNSLLKVGFIVSDFQRETTLARLEALLTYLPANKFETLVLDNDPISTQSELAQRSSLLSDGWFKISSESDEYCLQALGEFKLDALIDLDGHGPRQRLSVLLASDAPFKGTWNDSTTPLSFDARVQLIGGESIVRNGQAIRLPGMGELYDLPDIFPSKKNRNYPIFGCLTAAIRISSETWHHYIQLLTVVPNSHLVVNLADLGEPAKKFIMRFFINQGIHQERIVFVHATRTEELCECWNEIDIGLAPLHGSGGNALPTSLWMNVPFVALDSNITWSARPSALLKTVKCPELIASSLDNFLEIASKLAQEKPDYTFLRQHLQDFAIKSPEEFTCTIAPILYNACIETNK